MEPVTPSQNTAPVRKDVGHDHADLIEFALSRPGGAQFFVLRSVGEILEKYGKQLSMVGRIVSSIGDSLAGFGRWLQKNDAAASTALQGTVRAALGHQAVAMKKEGASASIEEQIILQLLAAVFQEIASDDRIPDDKLEEHLVTRLREISSHLIGAGHGAGLDDNVDEQKEKDISKLVVEKAVTKGSVTSSS